MLMSFNKRKLMKTLIATNIACGCSKLKPSDVLDPTPKPKLSLYQHTKNPNSLASSTTTSRDDHEEESPNKKKNIPKPSGKLVNTIAIEKDSEDPHEDFRNSVLQMIVEREIYSETDLRELLECFLQLNAPCHHQVIVKAFMEICEETFPKKKPHGGSGGDGVEESRRNNYQITWKH